MLFSDIGVITGILSTVPQDEGLERVRRSCAENWHFVNILVPVLSEWRHLSFKRTLNVAVVVCEVNNEQGILVPLGWQASAL